MAVYPSKVGIELLVLQPPQVRAISSRQSSYAIVVDHYDVYLPKKALSCAKAKYTERTHGMLFVCNILLKRYHPSFAPQRDQHHVARHILI